MGEQKQPESHSYGDAADRGDARRSHLVNLIVVFLAGSILCAERIGD
jgi:hypothetical protein